MTAFPSITNNMNGAKPEIAHIRSVNPSSILDPGKIRSLVVCDPGNREIKWIDPHGQVRLCPSVIYKLKDWEDAGFNANTFLIEVDGSRYLIGELAKKLGGKPAYEGNKTELAWILSLVAIEPNPGHDSVLIEKLKIALPDSRNDSVKHLKALEGTREFIRNGKPIVYTIREVQPVNECVPAFRYAQHKKEFQYPEAINGIIDFGGGTTIARLFDSEGTILRGGDIIGSGTFTLANEIAAALTPQFGYTPNPIVIMDAIADGSFTYGKGSGASNFQDLFTYALENWIEELRGNIRAKWSRFTKDGQLGEVLMVGGSAPLATKLTEASQGRFRVAEFPQVVSLYGMTLE